MPEAAVRTRDQRMADALDTLLVTSAESDGDAEPASRARSIPPASTKPAEIIVRSDFAAFVGTPVGIAEICGVGPIPPSTLGRLACNSDVSVEIFGDNLTPLYETVASRAPTAAQRRALIARDGACIGCGEPPGECEAHHIVPCQRGGKTRLDNLVLVCWHCHDLIHDHNWQVTIRDGRCRLAPPDPAKPAEPAPQRKPNRRAPQPAAEHGAPQLTAKRGSPQSKAERPSAQPNAEHRSTQPAAKRSSPKQAPTTTRPPPPTAGVTPLWDDPAS